MSGNSHQKRVDRRKKERERKQEITIATAEAQTILVPVPVSFLEKVKNFFSFIMKK